MRIFLAAPKPLSNLNLYLSNLANHPLLWGTLFSSAAPGYLTSEYIHRRRGRTAELVNIKQAEIPPAPGAIGGPNVTKMSPFVRL